MQSEPLTLSLTKEETPNKAVYAKGKFKLDIPRSSCPTPLPSSVVVTLKECQTQSSPPSPVRLDNRLEVVVEEQEVKTETVRYRRCGDEAVKLMGEPYIPKKILGSPWPKLMVLTIEWLKAFK